MFELSSAICECAAVSLAVWEKIDGAAVAAARRVVGNLGRRCGGCGGGDVLRRNDIRKLIFGILILLMVMVVIILLLLYGGRIQ